jgi:hypothetical protein
MTDENKDLEIIEEELEANEIEKDSLEEAKKEVEEIEANPNQLSKKEKKKLKREEKLKKKFFFEQDIKYRGPLSYRYLRLIAWASIAITQALTVNNLSGLLLEKPLISGAFEIVLILFSALSVPLFIIATFSTILNRSKPIKNVIIFYLAAYLGFALAIIIVYYRYVNNLLVSLGLDDETIKSVSIGLGNKLEINVFSDLFALSIFYFFIMCTPKKRFQGNKIIIFRLFSLIPLVVAFASYLIKVFANFGFYNIPFAFNPFLTTKSPFIYVLFIVLVFWLKKRERKYLSLGGTKQEYLQFEKTNRNSLSFSIFTSITCLVISIVDLVLYVIIYIFGGEFGEAYATLLQFGECGGLFIAIPILMLFSYSRRHKASSTDIIIVLSGIGMIAFAYIETIYEIIIAVTQSS